MYSVDNSMVCLRYTRPRPPLSMSEVTCYTRFHPCLQQPQCFDFFFSLSLSLSLSRSLTLSLSRSLALSLSRSLSLSLFLSPFSVSAFVASTPSKSDDSHQDGPPPMPHPFDCQHVCHANKERGSKSDDDSPSMEQPRCLILVTVCSLAATEDPRYHIVRALVIILTCPQYLH